MTGATTVAPAVPVDGPAEEPRVAAVGSVLAEAAALAGRLGRDDIAARLDEVSRRAARTDTIVCVVGEFKQGKSALVNALLGRSICPVDDDLATTAVTVVHHADPEEATVRRRDPAGLVTERIGADEIAAWAMEPEPTASERTDVELVDIGLAEPFLAGGVALVDTPGVGGLNAGHAAATLAFLPSADALVFVTDASAPLSATEIAFLDSAMRAGPPVVVAVTKIDMYPEWRRIVDIDARQLGAIGLDRPPMPVSSLLRAQARATGSETLERESGIGPFAAALLGDTVTTARAMAGEAARVQLGPALDQLREPLATELAALERPADAAALAEALADTRRRIDALAAADATWTVRLDDGFAALRTRVAFAFEGRMRQLTREAHGDIEAVDPAEAWPDLSRRVQEEVASAVRDAFQGATDGAADVQSSIASLLTDEELGLDRAGAPIVFDVRDLWEGRPGFAGRTKRGLVAGFGVFTGAKAGVEMLGMLGTLLGAAIIGPAVLGVALAMGGKEVLSERRRLLADRRQEARSFLDAFIEEVRFESEGRLATLLDDIQRQMRARFVDRIGELRRTYAESAIALESAAATAEATGVRRQAELRDGLAEIDRLAARAESIEPLV